MVRGLTVVTAVLVGSASHASAETSAELQQRGEAYAADGRFSEAIDAFKAADRIEQTTGHACLIALAYERRELWPQAEMFLDLCNKRASIADPQPDWATSAVQLIRDRLANANVAAVEILTEPSDVRAEITVSSFAPDERFSPRLVHMPFGHHAITVRAPGFEPEQRTIDITDKTSQRMVIKLYRTGQRPRDHFTRNLMLGGAAVFASGAVLNLTAYWYLRGKLDTNSPDQYRRYEGKYDFTRYAMFGLYGVGAVVTVTAAVLTWHDRRAPAVDVTPLPGGGMVSMGWQR
jgi:hypothetical protein